MSSIPTNPSCEVSTEAEETPPEVKRYQQQKLTATVSSLIVSLAFLIVMALWGGPLLDGFVRRWTGSGPWLRLVALAFVYAVGLELLTLPFDFCSGFVLEHRYGLSNQTLAGWM